MGLLDGGAGSDNPFGGNGDDTLTSGGDADIFACNPNEGVDIVRDCAGGLDVAELRGFAGVLAPCGSSGLARMRSSRLALAQSGWKTRRSAACRQAVSAFYDGLAEGPVLCGFFRTGVLVTPETFRITAQTSCASRICSWHRTGCTIAPAPGFRHSSAIRAAKAAGRGTSI